VKAISAKAISANLAHDRKSKGEAMLVLGRRKNQELVITGGIRIKVLSVRGGTVRLGIEAPREITIERAEILSEAGPVPARENPREVVQV
jgi:carbon storage regulator